MHGKTTTKFILGSFVIEDVTRFNLQDIWTVEFALIL
jgi:hypothetical protein